MLPVEEVVGQSERLRGLRLGVFVFFPYPVNQLFGHGVVENRVDEVAFLQREVVVPVPIVMQAHGQVGFEEMAVVGEVSPQGFVAVVIVKHLD